MKGLYNFGLARVSEIDWRVHKSVSTSYSKLVSNKKFSDLSCDLTRDHVINDRRWNEFTSPGIAQ